MTREKLTVFRCDIYSYRQAVSKFLQLGAAPSPRLIKDPYRFFLRRIIQGLHTQTYSTLFIDFQYLDPDNIAFFQHVADILDTLV